MPYDKIIAAIIYQFLSGPICARIPVFSQLTGKFGARDSPLQERVSELSVPGRRSEAVSTRIHLPPPESQENFISPDRTRRPRARPIASFPGTELLTHCRRLTPAAPRLCPSERRPSARHGRVRPGRHRRARILPLALDLASAVDQVGCDFLAGQPAISRVLRGGR